MVCAVCLSIFFSNETVYRGRRRPAVGPGSRPPGVGHTGGRSLRKVSTSLHHIASTDNFQIHSTER